MRHRDFGRPADEEHEPPPPSWPDGSTHPYPLPLSLAQAGSAEDEVWPPDDSQPPGAGRRSGESRPSGDRGDSGKRAAASPRTYQPDQFGTIPLQPTVPRSEPFYPWPLAPSPGSFRDAAQSTATRARSRGGRRQSTRRWMIPAWIAAGCAFVGAAAVLLTAWHPDARGTGAAAPPSAEPTMMTTHARASPSPDAEASAPLTLARAQSVLARYTTANNRANAQRSGALLATVETGSSYAIDVGIYRTQAAERAATYPLFSPVQATYYIPGGEPAAGPHWFVVQVANAFQFSPSDVTSDEYLLFTQSTPGGTWQNAIEPYLLPAASAPQIAVGDGGLATAVSRDATSVTVAPGQLPAVTAASLDGSGARARTGQGAIANPGNLADTSDQETWQAKLPGDTVTDTRAPAAGTDGQEFALRTTSGGALVFYTDAAEVTVTSPTGSPLRLTVPGIYSASQDLTQVSVGYLEQFATYDPPADGGAPRIVADYSGITKNP